MNFKNDVIELQKSLKEKHTSNLKNEVEKYEAQFKKLILDLVTHSDELHINLNLIPCDILVFKHFLCRENIKYLETASIITLYL